MGPIFSLPVSGMRFGPRCALATHRSQWLTGGAYGPEGGAITTVFAWLSFFWLAEPGDLPLPGDGRSLKMSE